MSEIVRRSMRRPGQNTKNMELKELKKSRSNRKGRSACGSKDKSTSEDFESRKKLRKERGTGHRELLKLEKQKAVSAHRNRNTPNNLQALGENFQSSPRFRSRLYNTKMIFDKTFG